MKKILSLLEDRWMQVKKITENGDKKAEEIIDRTIKESQTNR